MAKMWRRFWYFIWEDNSILSWLVNVVLAFVIIKFLVYPGLGFILSTSNPVVAVVSCSMEHNPTNCGRSDPPKLCGRQLDSASISFDEYWAACGPWYENQNISSAKFSTFHLKNGFNKGDLIILKGKSFDNLNVGEIIVFRGNDRDPVIHRIVVKNNDSRTFATKGDNNDDQLFYERNIPEEQIIGKALFKIPLLGYVKIIFTDLINLVIR